MRERRTIYQFSAGMLASAFIFGLLNYMQFQHSGVCDDCFRSYGVPFTAYQWGGFVTVTRLIWLGIVADLLVMLVVGIAIGWLLNKIVERRNSRIEQN
jgi:hypothetical protein